MIEPESEGSKRIGSALSELFAKHNLSSLQVKQGHKIRNKVEGNRDVRYMYRAQEVVASRVHAHVPDNNFAPYVPDLFRASVGEDGASRFTEFVTGAFPTMQDDWHQFLAEHDFKTTHSVEHLDLLLGKLVEALRREAVGLGLDGTVENVNRLLTVRMALSAGLIKNASTLPELQEPLAQWLREDIDTSMILFAFGPRQMKGVMRMPPPLMPLEDAKEAQGIPIGRLRVLYKPDEPEPGDF